MRIRIALAIAACGVPLAACGSSEIPHSSRGKAAVINAALRKLQAETEAQQAKLGVRGKLILGWVTLVYAAPPKGISAAEWRTAVQRDQALQHVMTSGSK